MISTSLVILGLTTAVQLSSALENGLARTPPMGWLDWERFTCTIDCEKFPNSCINERLFKQIADRLVSGGYRDAGYQYVNIDDCWSTHERDSDDRLVPNPNLFPSGIGGLSEYIHSKGLKIGIYGDCGNATCAGYPAQLKYDSTSEDNYFDVDSKTFVDWKIDSFKFDGCNIVPTKAEQICPGMTRALMATDRPILLTCEWPLYLIRDAHEEPDFALAQKFCNLWRYLDDVEDSWLSIMRILDTTVKMQNTIAKYHGPGHWFDPDMLVIGNFGLSLEQARAQMAIWSIWSAPLFMSNDLRDISPEMESILLNKNVIKVDQDRMGVFGMLAAQKANNLIQAFVKPVERIHNGCPSFAIVYLNRQTLGNGHMVEFNVRDLVSNSAIGIAAERWAKLWADDNRAGEPNFKAETCRTRLAKSMTKNPNDPLRSIVIKPQDFDLSQELEYQQVYYDVYDLFEDKQLTTVGLDSVLKLNVKPQGVRMVRLVEAPQTKPIPDDKI